MCGIMGFYCFGTIRPDKKQIADLFKLLESRGRDASGYAYLAKGIDGKFALRIMKSNVVASELLRRSSSWSNLQLPKMMIFHTRAMTKGSEKNNMNNHPLFTKDGLAIVHNGMISNDDVIFKNSQLTRDAQVDSEAILATLASARKKQSEDVINDVFKNVYGDYAVASIDAKRPDELLLFRHSNPIEVYYDKKKKIMYFCSERSMMQEALKIKQTYDHGFPIDENGFYYITFHDNHGLVINSSGVAAYKKYTPKTYYYSNYGHENRRYSSYYDYDDDENEKISNKYSNTKPEQKNETKIGNIEKEGKPIVSGSKIKDCLWIKCPHCGEFTRFDVDTLNNYCEECCLAISREEAEQYVAETYYN